MPWRGDALDGHNVLFEHRFGLTGKSVHFVPFGIVTMTQGIVQTIRSLLAAKSVALGKTMKGWLDDDDSTAYGVSDWLFIVAVRRVCGVFIFDCISVCSVANACDEYGRRHRAFCVKSMVKLYCSALVDGHAWRRRPRCWW